MHRWCSHGNASYGCGDNAYHCWSDGLSHRVRVRSSRLASQNVSLAYVNPSQAALLLSLESVFGVLFSVLLYGEVMTSRLLVGFALIFVAILVNEVVAPRVEAKRAIVAFGRDKWKEDGLMTNTTETSPYWHARALASHLGVVCEDPWL